MVDQNNINCRLFSYDGESETTLSVSLNDFGNVEINAYVNWERTSIELSTSGAMELSRQLHQAAESVISKARGAANG